MIKKDRVRNRTTFPEVNVQLKPSTRHGTGVFAARSFIAGERIGEISGIFFLETDEPQEPSNFVIDAGGPYLLEPFAPFCYLNHSCDPNALLCHDDRKTHPPGVLLYAKRDILRGEELTVDYAWLDRDEVVPCHCGSGCCRGTITIRGGCRVLS